MPDADDVRYFVQVEPAVDEEREGNEPVADGPCSLCGDVGPRLPRAVPPPVPRAPYAFAGIWLLCGVCDALAESGDVAALLDRFRPLDLTAEQARELAGLLAAPPEG